MCHLKVKNGWLLVRPNLLSGKKTMGRKKMAKNETQHLAKCLCSTQGNLTWSWHVLTFRHESGFLVRQCFSVNETTFQCLIMFDHSTTGAFITTHIATTLPKLFVLFHPCCYLMFTCIYQVSWRVGINAHCQGSIQLSTVVSPQPPGPSGLLSIWKKPENSWLQWYLYHQ